MFLHCHDCGWEQDDYWSKDYNPLKSLRDWEHDLLDFSCLDAPWLGEPGAPPSTREAIAQACERAARNIRGMVFLRPEDAKEKCCPRCGSKNLDED